MKARRARVDKLLRRLSEEVNAIAPPGLGHDSEAWRIVEEPSGRLLDLLHEWVDTGDRERLFPEIRTAYYAVTSAWQQAAHRSTANPRHRTHRGYSLSTDRIIASKPTGRPGEEVHIALSPYNGRTYLNARKWYTDAAGELKPGKGVSLPVTDLPWLQQALAKAEAVALRDGLLDEESYESCGLPLPPELLRAA